MAVERFKTQVLILHPEQKLLDACRQSLGDEYHVHLARSGKEALSTLGDTPIDFIISAQDLPGMSGAEALREAHKRSPETVGILLTSPNANAGEIEALAGSEQIFQVLKGGNSSGEISAIVESAANKMKMGELRDSANDSVANAPSLRPEPFMSDIAVEDDEVAPFIATVADLPTAGMRTHVGGREIEVLILSQDPVFIRSIEDAGGIGHTVHHAPTLHEAIDILNLGRVGVLVSDAAVAPSDVEIITQRLREIQPSLVTIVAGRRDDGDALMGLIATGTIYRFLLKPVSAGRARLAIEASVKKSIEYRESPPPPPAPRTQTGQTAILDLARDDNDGWNFGRLAIAGGVLAAIVGLGLYFLLGGDSATPPPVADLADEIIQAQPEEASPAIAEPAAETELAEVPQPISGDAAVADSVAQIPTVEEFRRRAFRALTDGRIVMPPEDNALSLYASAMLANPGADGLQADFDNAVSEALVLTERALIEGQLEDAGNLLARIREVQPYQTRLPFLEAQLLKERQRTLLEQARTTAAAGDIPAALAIIDSADALTEDPDPAVEAARGELLATRESLEIDKLLEFAGERLQSGNLISPARDSARYYYRTILAKDSGNKAASQGLGFVAAKLMDDAEAALAAGEFDSAGALLTSARNTGIGTDAADTLAERIEAERELAAAAESETTTDAVTAGVADTPVESDTDATGGETAAAEDPSGDAAADAAEAGAGAILALQPGGSSETQSRDDPVESGSAANADESPPAQQSGTLIQTSELIRTNYVQPVFPRAAIRRGRSGWVDLEFTITEQGSVAEIEILEAEPGTAFNKAAVSALQKWEYEPVIENGVAIPRRARIRIQFNLAE